MSVSRNAKVSALAALAVAGFLVAGPVLGAPLAQDNLLRNGGFEEASTAGWEFFWAPGSGEGCIDDRPDINVTDATWRIHSGGRAASYYINWRTFQAGFYQQVSATSGTIYRLTAWGHMWATDDVDVTTSNYPVEMRVGIDPTGGTNYASGNIIWSGAADARDTYQQFTIEATAQANTVTVFLYARSHYCVDKTDAYWDDASLVVVGQAEQPEEEEEAPAAPPPPPSSGVPMGSIPRSTPAPDGSVIHVVQPGETLIGIAVTYNIGLDELRQLNNITGSLIVPGQELVIQLPTGPGAGEPEPSGEGAEGAEGGEATEGGEGADVAEAEESAPPEEALPEGNGTICVMAFEDLNANTIREEIDEQPLPGVTFTVTDGTQQVIGTYTTDGINEPFCFTDLIPGTYIISWGSDSYQPTGEQMWVANVIGGTTVSREFGALTGGAAETLEGETGGAGRSRLITALAAAGGVVLLMVGIGAAIYFFVLRRPVTQ